jgi:hypothetical protein
MAAVTSDEIFLCYLHLQNSYFSTHFPTLFLLFLKFYFYFCPTFLHKDARKPDEVVYHICQWRISTALGIIGLVCTCTIEDSKFQTFQFPQTFLTNPSNAKFFTYAKFLLWYRNFDHFRLLAGKLVISMVIVRWPIRDMHLP